MKAVILAGGLGTRISEETTHKPKPMVSIGGRPIIWHIMKMYSHYGINDFIICLGYKGYVIKEYFLEYFAHNSDITLDLDSNLVEFHRKPQEKWKITLLDTGLHTQTGGRLKRVAKYLDNESFCMTYGDAVTDVDIKNVVEFHKSNKCLATVTAVRPIGRFGALQISGDTVTDFVEKPAGGSGWINGGFFVLSPEVIKYIEGDTTIWEHEPLTELAKSGNLSAYRHDGFWHCMDTLRDKQSLESLWEMPQTPWKVWE